MVLFLRYVLNRHYAATPKRRFFIWIMLLLCATVCGMYTPCSMLSGDDKENCRAESMCNRLTVDRHHIMFVYPFRNSYRNRSRLTGYTSVFRNIRIGCSASEGASKSIFDPDKFPATIFVAFLLLFGVRYC